MIQDIRPYTKLATAFYKNIEPRRLELAEMIAQRSGKTTKIDVYEIGKHEIVDDVDTDGTDYAIVGPKYCWKCREDLDNIFSNECRRRI